MNISSSRLFILQSFIHDKENTNEDKWRNAVKSFYEEENEITTAKKIDQGHKRQFHFAQSCAIVLICLCCFLEVDALLVCIQHESSLPREELKIK